MDKILTSLYPAMFFAFIFSGLKLTRNGVSDEYMSLEQSKIIQAIFCVFVMFHHLAIWTIDNDHICSGLMHFFHDKGFIFTSFFFFFSGYGLLISLHERQNYLDGFLLRRLSRTLIPFWITNTIGIVLRLIVNPKCYDVKHLLMDLFGFTLVNPNAWFFVEISIIYIAFFMIFYNIENEDVAIFVMCLFIICMIVISMFLSCIIPYNVHYLFVGMWWHDSTVLFIFGILYARFKKQVTTFLQKYYLQLLFTSIACSIFFWLTLNCMLPVRIDTSDVGTHFMMALLTCIFTVTMVLLINMKITFGNRILVYLSKIVPELLLIHGYFISIVSNSRMEDYMRYGLVIIASIVTSVILNQL